MTIAGPSSGAELELKVTAPMSTCGKKEEYHKEQEQGSVHGDDYDEKKEGDDDCEPLRSGADSCADSS